MTHFLLELLSEEIPARMQDKARADLARLFAAELEKAGLAAAAIETFATPRRLALIARDLPAFTAAVSEETKGPRTSAPPQALEGFLRKVGVEQHQLTERDGVWFAVVEKPGRATADVLADAIPAIVRAFPWPKSMRWGAASASSAAFRWVRPLRGIVALLGEDVVPFEIEGVASGAATVGHRFHHPGAITIGSADDYAEKLRLCHVIVDQDERARIIAEGGAALATANGLSVIPDPGLVAENAGLTEWPVPLLGFFDPAFLDVPREVIQLTLRTNQKYFVLNDGAGKLAPAFLCTANIDAVDGGEAIVAGNGKVLAARLSDARFFWEQDLKVRLEDQAQKLGQIVFHEKLGTVADKVERVAKLARWLVEEGIVTSSPLPLAGGAGGGQTTPKEEPTPNPSRKREGDDVAHLADLAEQAARLSKADLVTGMVGEFPELQGIMGGYYARAEGLPDAVADAIRDHYKPVGQGDDVPTAPVTVAVSLADKLDSLVCFFGIDQKPTGSKDPFALRRAMLGCISIIRTGEIRAPMNSIVRGAIDICLDSFEANHPAVCRYNQSQTSVDVFATELVRFAVDRLIVQARDEGLRHDVVVAAFEIGMDSDLVRLLARVKALQAFVETEDGANLLAGYKRAANILRKEKWEEGAPPAILSTADEQGVAQTGEEDPLVLVDDPLFRETVADLDAEEAGGIAAREPEEQALATALGAAEGRASAAIADEDFAGAMSALASLRAPIDAFFERVVVNDADPAKRAARLGLLGRIRRACHQVADFSRIEG